MKRKHFILALVAMLLGFASPSFAQVIEVRTADELREAFAALENPTQQTAGLRRSASLRSTTPQASAVVAVINGTEYTEADFAGMVIRLSADIVYEDPLAIGATANATIDLNGHTLSGATKAGTKHTIPVYNSGKLLIKDSSAEGDGAIDCGIYNGRNASGTKYEDEAILVMIGGRIICHDEEEAALTNFATAYIGGGSLEGAVDAVKNEQGTVIIKDGVQLTGSVEGTVDADPGVLYTVATIGDVKYASIDAAFAAAKDGETIKLLSDVTPTLTSQRAITKASVIDLDEHTMTLKEDDLYFGTTTFKNGTIVVDPTVNASTAVFWMFENQTLTFDNVDIVATGVSGTYLIGINGGTGSAINLLNGSTIVMENTTVGTIICDNGRDNVVTIKDSEISVNDATGTRFYLGGTDGDIVVENSKLTLEEVKEGFYIRAGQELSINGNSDVNITLGDPSSTKYYGINLTDFTAVYTKETSATVNASLYQPTAMAMIGSKKYETLQAAINAAVDGDVIVLQENVTEDVTITQKADVDVTIDGAGKTFTGVMTIDGARRHDGAETLTIKNVVFQAVDGKGECIASGTGNNAYAHNVTIEGCTFKGNDTYSKENTFAIRFPSGGVGYDLTVQNCTADDKMFGLLWVTQVVGDLIVDNCTAEGVTEGIVLTNTTKATITNTKIDASNVAIRAGQVGDADGTVNDFEFNENTLKSGNIAIQIRGNATDANLSMTRNVVSGSTHISGVTEKTNVSADANYWDGNENPTVAAGSAAVKVNSYYTDAALNNLVRNEMGSISVAYASTDRFFGEANGNAVARFVVKLLNDENEVMGTATLKNTALINGNVNVSWYIRLNGESSNSWDVAWTASPAYDNLPTKVQLFVDDVMVAENSVQMNAPDNINKINAAVLNADGKTIASLHTTFEEAVAAGNNVAIMTAGTYNVPTGKDLTITGAVEGVEFGPIAEPNMGMKNYTFKNVTFNYANDSHYKGLQYAGTMVYNNCTFNGQVFLYGQSETFNKCIFNQVSSDYYNVWTYSAKDVAFNECTFNSAGKSVLVYHESSATFNNVAVNNTTFNASAPVDGKAAIEMDASLTAGANVTINNSTATGFGAGNVSGNSLWNNKKGNADAANNDITVTVDSNVVLQPVFDAQIGTAQYRTLQDAISAVKDGETITLLRDVAYDVTITQTADVDVTIDGDGKKFDGTIYLQGNSRHTGAETLTIKNINFETAKDKLDFIQCDNGGDAVIRYPHNITIENCNFTATAANNTVVATRFRQCYNVKIVGGTFTNLFSPMWATGGENIAVEGVKVLSSNGGLSFGTAKNVSVKDIELTAQKHGVRVDASQATSLTVSGSKINAFIPVVARYATADYAIVMADNNEFTATNTDTLWCAVGATEYKENGAVPSDATGVVTVALNGTGLDINGVNGLKARIGNVYYFSFEKAYAAAQPGDTVTILAANITGNLDVNKAITVQGETDALGNNLVNYTGKLNITADGATVKKINFNNGNQTAGYIRAKDVTVDSCQVVGGNGFRYCYTEGTVTFKNSVITGATYGIHFDGSDGGNIVIDNCTITGWTSFAQAIKKVSLANTTFNEGNYNYVRFYQKEVEISGCEFNENMAVDLATNEAKVTVENSTVVNKTVEDLFYGVDIVNSTITVDGVKLIRIAHIGDEYFETITEAINAAADNDTIQILKGEFDEVITPWTADPSHTVEKSITILGAENFGTTLKGGLYLGYDDSQCREHNIVVKGIHFVGKGLTVACQKNVTIEDNKFTNITDSRAIAVIGKDINSVVKNNVINTAELGIELRNTLTAHVEGNTVSSTQHNSIQITSQVGATNSTATVLNNTLSDWGLGGEGRAMRINGIVTATVNGNVMTHSATAPEEYVKVTSATTLDASQNYWAGVNPIIDGMFNTDMVADRAALLKNYYIDADKQTLADISASPFLIGDTYYRTFIAALEAVKDGETIILTGVPGSELNQEITFDKAINFTITGNAPQYALPVVTFQNATVTIKGAEISIPELDARQNATINVENSTVYSAGGNSIVKSYYNGAINITDNSKVYTHQATTMGYINIDGTSLLNVTWQTNIYGNGMITLSEGATLNTAALNLTAQDYSGRDNTDTERIGKPATIVVDGANLTAGKVYSASGADYSYETENYGINVGTIAGKAALLDIKDGANVNFWMKDGYTINFGAGATVNVDASTLNVLCRDAEGTVTLANAGTVNVSGASNLAAAKVTGDGWFYMNGVTLDANTKLLGAKVRFAKGTNTLDGATIDDGSFQVGIGAYNGVDANVDTVNGVVVNVKNNAHIGAGGNDYQGWIGTGYYDTDAEKAAAMTAAKYVLSIENSIAEFGYLHVSNDGELIVNGVPANKAHYNNSEYAFYAGNLIVNGTADFNDTDVLAIYTNVSCDNGTTTPGTLNINGTTEYEAERHNGAIDGTNFQIRKTGVVNVATSANLQACENSSIAAGATLNIQGQVTAKGTLTNNGAIIFTNDAATLTTPTSGLTVGYDLDSDKKVVYADGAYKVVSKIYVAQIGTQGYESFAEALTAAADGETVELLWSEGDPAISMAGTVCGKTVTITGTADVDWSKGWFYIGRNGAADGKVIFDNANLDSKSANLNSGLGINVSGRKKGSADTFNGALEIKNSTIVLDYLIQKNVMTLDNSTLTVKNGCGLTGRLASETENGELATSTTNLNNGSKLVVNNPNGMALGYEGYGVLNIDATSTFETTQAYGVAANGRMNVNGGTVKIAGTLTNNGTVYVTGASTLDAKVTGDGWFYMNGVTLDANTKLLGAKVAFINGENTVKGSTIKDGWFSVGIGQNAAAATFAAFAEANGITLGDVTVNVSDNATIYTSTDVAYSGWVGSAYSAAKDAHKYILNITNSLARFGYMHVSKDGELNATGHSDNKYEYAGNTVDFYAGTFINNGNVTLNGVDAWAMYSKISVDHADAVLNIVNGTKYMSNCTTGDVNANTFLYYQAGTVNVDKTSSVNIEKATTFVDGAVLNIAGNVTAKGAITGNATINFTDMGATLAAQEGLTINHNFEGGYTVERIDGVYRISHYVASVNGVNYESLEAALKALTDGATLTLLENFTTTELWDCRSNGAKVTKNNVTIDGNGMTLKLAGAVDDRNWNTVFRFEGDNATVKNLTIDVSEATGIERGISSKLSLTVDSCTFIGNGTTTKRAIIFGEGAGAALANVVATVTNSTFKNWSYGVSDNQSGKDAKDVTVNNNKFENASVLISAAGEINFNQNTLTDGYVNITSYTNAAEAHVHATGNNLDSDEENQITVDPAHIWAQTSFATPQAKIDGKYFLTVQKAIDKADGQTVTLIYDVELTEKLMVASDKELTLDLSRWQLTTTYDEATQKHLYAIENHGTLTIKGDEKGEIFARGIDNYGALILYSGTINACDANGGYGVHNYAGADFIMEDGGKLITSNDGGDAPGAGYDATTLKVDAGATATINAGEINNVCNFTYAIDNAGEVYINGGTITSVHTTLGNAGEMDICGGTMTCNGAEGVTSHVLYAREGSNTTVTGGEFNGKDNYNGFNINAATGANVSVEGGKFYHAHSGAVYGDGNVVVTGGQFEDKVADQYCELGYTCEDYDSDGWFLIELTNTRDEFTIVDGADEEFVVNAPMQIGKLTYKRTFSKANVWQALYVPFEIPVEALTDQFDITYINDVHTEYDAEGTAIRTYAEQVRISKGTLKANYPYLIRVKEGKSLNMELVLDNVTLCKTEENSVDCSSVFVKYTITGIYHQVYAGDIPGMYALDPSGGWKQASNPNVKLSPFRLYMTITDRNGEPVILDPNGIQMFIRGEEEPTGIDVNIFNKQDKDFIYDLQGRRVLNPVKGGVYIVNGKKIYFK